jgi:hypothetical protein
VIKVAVEGDTDVPFVTQLCNASGFDEILAIIDANGKDEIDARIDGFAKAGHYSPHLIVRDLDQDAECAATWVAAHVGKSGGPFFSLRIAVRAVEAWFLADRDNAAASLRLRIELIPNFPEAEADPKLTLVNLARRSGSARVRSAIVPAVGMSRKTGPGYAGWLQSAAANWSFTRARSNSPSLERAHRALVALNQTWAKKFSATP